MIWETVISYLDGADGKEKSKKARFVIADLATFGEVENMLVGTFGSWADMEVVAIKQSRVKEIVNKRTNQDEKIFEATLRDVFVDDDGNEKVNNYKMLLFAKNFDKAKDFITEYIRQGYDLTLVKLKETSFLDIL